MFNADATDLPQVTALGATSLAGGGRRWRLVKAVLIHVLCFALCWTAAPLLAPLLADARFSLRVWRAMRDGAPLTQMTLAEFSAAAAQLKALRQLRPKDDALLQQQTRVFQNIIAELARRDRLPAIPVSIANDDAFTCSFGNCVGVFYEDPPRIVLKPEFVLTGSFSEVVNAVRHEYTHYFVFKRIGEDTAPHGHGEHFLRACLRLGVDPSDTWVYDDTLKLALALAARKP